MEGWSVAFELAELGSLGSGSDEVPVLVTSQLGSVPARQLDPGFTGDAMELLEPTRYQALNAAAVMAASAGDKAAQARFGPPYRHPQKIWGIGLNYRDHAQDLAAPEPDEPASFIKANHTIIGPNDPIVIPWQSGRVTAEAELGIVIGRYCRNVAEEDALDYVFGVCPILDQTAEDILLRNPRFLTRAKNFPTFFSFGPTIIPLPKVLARYRELADIEVSTVLNDQVVRANRVGNMLFSVATLISFHSQVMPLFPGDIISTGTPGAVPVRAGDIVECRLGTLATLRNPVVAEPGSEMRPRHTNSESGD